MLLTAWLVACSQPVAPECPDCPECEQPPQGESLNAFEASLLGPVLEDLRAGVRPFPGSEQGFGLCKGDKDCDTFLGLDGGTLSEGQHMVRAELSVPAVGEGWAARFRLDCQVTGPTGKTSTVDHEKIYDLKYTGPKRGYSLQPLMRIQSPHPGGERVCTYSLTPLSPDGAEGEPISGSYTTPMPS
jgi:hypothetical protein